MSAEPQTRTNSSGGLRREFMRVGPHGDAHWVAMRAALTVAVPLVLLVLTDHVEWILYAGFGAFTALYGRAHGLHRRLRMQSVVGALMVISILGGVLVGTSDDRVWLTVPAATLLAGAASAVSDRQQWHPPGPLFMIFAMCACASVPSTTADLVPALLVSSAVVVFAVLVGCAGPWVRSLRGAPSDPTPYRAHPVELRHVVRGAVGVAVAGSIATLCGIGHPYWAMVSAVVPLVARSLEGQLLRGIQRVVGTAFGLALAALLLHLDLPIWATIVVIIALQGAAELLIGRNYALALVVITPLALLMVYLVAPTPSNVLIGDRGIETVIGVAVGVAVGWLTRRRD